MKFAALLFLANTAVGRAGLGTGLWRTYSKYVEMPINTTAAADMGWVQVADSCDPALGVMWAQSDDGPTEKEPIVLYFTPAGQVTGVGTRASGDFYGETVDQGFWQQIDDEVYFVSVTFRSADNVCSDETHDEPLGNSVIINANSLAKTIPMTQDLAIEKGYETGSCFASMGTHSFWDIVGDNGTMTWSATNLMPVVPMYDRTNDWALNAIFFTTPWIQQGLFNANQWEPVALANFLMCKNFCDDDCGWDDTNFWSTMHIYFSDPSQVTCLDGCTIGCCE